MPTYEYVCQSCGTHVEVWQRFSDESLSECGVCGGRLRKVFHPAGILFKGSGFYVTDSRAGRRVPKSESKGEAKAGSGAGGSGSRSSESSGSSSRPKGPGASKGSRKDTSGSSEERSA